MVELRFCKTQLKQYPEATFLKNIAPKHIFCSETNRFFGGVGDEDPRIQTDGLRTMLRMKRKICHQDEKK